MSVVTPTSANVPSASHPAMRLMGRETRVRKGKVPRELAGQAVGDGFSLMSGNTFLLRTVEGIGLIYRQGEGVTLEHPEDADERDISLWLNGVLYAAIAAINGLLPLHASAVAHDGRVYAFSGPPGAGKSTLAAALGLQGMPLFCDDTLILDLSGGGPITCLPGHKRLKLWPEGLALAGAKGQEQVATHYPKHFASPAAGLVAGPLPLAELLFLEVSDRPEVVQIPPGERIARLQDDHYTARIFAEARAASPAERFSLLANIAARLPMRRFKRPFEVARFDNSAQFIGSYIQE